MVDRPLTLTLDDLKRLPAESRICFVECIGNSAPGKHDGPAMREGKEPPKSVQEIHGRTSCSEWTGVPLSVVLNEAGVQKGASWIVSEGADSGKFSNSLPLTKAMDDVLLAYSQNGEAVRPEQGYPVKLLVPGWHGPFSVKWLRQIKVVDEPYMTMMEVTTHAYSKPILNGKERWFHFEMQPKSVILRPALGRSPARPRILRDNRLGVVRHGRHSQGRGIHRRRPELEGREASGAGVANGAHPVSFGLDVGRGRDGASVPLHG